MMVKVSTHAPAVIVNFVSFFSMRFFSFLLLGFLTAIVSGQANDTLPALDDNHAILLEGAALHPVSSASIPHGKLLMRDGRIVGIGAMDVTLEGEAEAMKISCSGQHI